MAGQWTMADQDWVYTGQILHYLVIYSFKEILTIYLLIVTWDNICVSETKRPDNSVLMKFLVVANFHNVVKY